MKLYALITLILFLAMLFIPLFSLLGQGNNTTANLNVTTSAPPSTQADETTTESKKEIETIKVMMTASDKVSQMDMTSYLIGCVAAEMPAEYEIEALKAQAVASYSYARFMKNNNADNKSDISDNPSVHQAYMSEGELKERWGDNFDKRIEKIRKAVEETKGEYLTFDSEPIKPAYHALSSGKTNSAEDVWGGEIPWLTSVNSISDKLSPAYETSFQFSNEELITLLKSKSVKDISLGDIVTTSSGYVKSISISDIDFTGEELRSLLSLRSGNFKVEAESHGLKFICCGYGHGVGMSQYGANEMAKNGSDYKEILSHYYQGVDIAKD